MELTYRDFTKECTDPAPLGISKRARDETHFCTPKGARVIGWAGVDSIHYCMIRGFGEMEFAVSPVNLAPHYVHPLARTFRIFCGCWPSGGTTWTSPPGNCASTSRYIPWAAN